MRRLLAIMVLVPLFAACSGQGGGAGGATQPAQATSNGGGATPGAGGGGATAASGGGGASLAAAAAKVTDWCALIPSDVIARFAPSAPPAAKGVYPGECGASNGVGALEFRYVTGFGPFEIPSGSYSKPMSGVGQAAYYDNPTVDEIELYVALQLDPEVSLFIDVAGHDGKDHQADAVDIANSIIAKLGGG